MSVLEITWDNELTANCPLETSAKLGELILARYVNTLYHVSPAVDICKQNQLLERKEKAFASLRKVFNVCALEA